MPNCQKPLTSKLINPNIITGEMWSYNFNQDDIKYVCQPYGFWKDIVYAWTQINFKNPVNINEVLMQKIWFNSCIRVGNKPFYVKEYAKAQISQLSDFLHETENRFFNVY